VILAGSSLTDFLTRLLEKYVIGAVLRPAYAHAANGINRISLRKFATSGSKIQEKGSSPLLAIDARRIENSENGFIRIAD
jgi:hypothetical protein